jgi:hypothetical protein
MGDTHHESEPISLNDAFASVVPKCGSSTRTGAAAGVNNEPNGNCGGGNQQAQPIHPSGASAARQVASLRPKAFKQVSEGEYFPHHACGGVRDSCGARERHGRKDFDVDRDWPSGNLILGDSIITQSGGNIGIGTDSRHRS